MFKRTVTMMLAAGTLVLGGCASNGGAEQAAADNCDFGGKSIYLRGEMNDWMATDESKVVKVADKLYMAKGTLKKEWAPTSSSLLIQAGAAVPTLATRARVMVLPCWVVRRCRLTPAPSMRT